MAAARVEDHHRVDERDRPPYLADAVAASPQLRRDIRNALTAGVSPRRYAGWEPATRYTYDDQGRVANATREPEWDELDNVLVDLLQEWQAGVHSCGHHESEQADPDTVFVPGFSLCKACEALQVAQEKQAKADESERKKGHNPDYPRRWFVLRRSRAEVLAERAEHAGRKSPREQMAEAVARLDQS